MSASHSDKCEPNLTPLLDMVLQLVMFFMLCANFVMEQVNESVKLPLAIEAKALDKSVDNYIILNVVKPLDNNGKYTLPAYTDIAGEQYMNSIQVRNRMRTVMELDQARAKPSDWAQGKGRSIVILRASRECRYKEVHDVMSACRQAGFTDIQLRAIKASPE